jgi:hypothetical protein
MKQYYISRGVLSIVMGVVVYLISNSLLIGASSVVLVFMAFVWLSRSGRYRVNPEMGVRALKRDEWTQGITDKSGRNAWVAVAITGSLVILFYGVISPGNIPVSVLGILLLSGIVTYYVSDFWLRRL